MKKEYSSPVDAILLLGPTGVGKSPLGDHIARHGFLGRKSHHLDFGSELRSIASGNGTASVYSQEELDFVTGVLERGLLLENEHFILAEKITRLFLDGSGFSSGHILVLNGIPRHVGQAQDISAMARIHSLIVLECSVDDVFCRIKDNVGGDRTGRPDDERKLIEKKISIFQERTAPLIEHYASKGCAVYRLGISNTTTTDQAYQQLLSLAAAYPPVSLVAEPPQ